MWWMWQISGMLLGVFFCRDGYPFFWPHLCARVIDHHVVNFSTPDYQGCHKNNCGCHHYQKKETKVKRKHLWPRMARDWNNKAIKWMRTNWRKRLKERRVWVFHWRGRSPLLYSHVQLENWCSNFNSRCCHIQRYHLHWNDQYFQDHLRYWTKLARTSI